MKYVLCLICLIIGTVSLSAQQQTALGQWRAHLPAGTGSSVSASEDRIFLGNQSAMYAYDMDENSFQYYSKTNGLSDINVRKLKYDPETGWLLIIYENLNIDLIREGTFKNVPAIKNSQILGSKKANNISFHNSKAYISTDFGLLELDMESGNILNTYKLGENGSTIKILASLVKNDTIMVASEEGLLSADINHPGLFNFINWYRYDADDGVLPGQANHLVHFNNKFHTFINEDIMFLADGVWQKAIDIEENYNIRSIHASDTQMVIAQRLDDGVSEASRLLYLSDTYSSETFTDTRTQRLEEAIILDDGTTWIADKWSGLVRVKDNESENFRPNGPETNRSFKMAAVGNKVMVAPGSVEANWNVKSTQFGFYEYIDNDWDSYSSRWYGQLDNIRDIIDVAIHPISGDPWFASALDGLIEHSEVNGIRIWNDSNSTVNLLGSVEGNFKITGLTFDYNNNLWVSNHSATEPLLLRTGDENAQWLNFRPDVSTNNFALNEITTDIYGQVWALIHEGGVLVYSPGANLYSIADDAYAVIKQGEGQGGLPSNNTYSIASDKDGEMWIGTDAGVAIVPCPQLVTEGNCEAFQPIVTIDGFNGPLFQSEIVRDIEVDGGNRKWIGTENGVWLLSEDGEEVIEYFTKENSPLFSNVIRDITIDPSSGEVFIGTENGILSYRGTSTEATDLHENVQVFPNPVRPEYSGIIAIRGLANESEVKITDISGTLVYETQAEGGVATWNGMNYNGVKAQTGVYLVYSTSEDGSDGHVAKIMFIN